MWEYKVVSIPDEDYSKYPEILSIEGSDSWRFTGYITDSGHSTEYLLERKIDKENAMSMISNEELINRFGYHRATADSAPKHARVRELFLEVANSLNVLIPDGRDKATAMTKLQEAMHWSNSAIAMENDVDTETAHLPNA